MNSAILLRRFCCFSVTAISSSSSSSASASSSLSPPKKKSLVFLGSPQVSAIVLDALFNASAAPDSSFEVAAIVTQPPARRDRGRKLMPSPVAQYAMDKGFSPELVFTPERAVEEAFLSSLKALQPEICITAAYGNILPRKFLNIPVLGTVNIHPSLLPLYRGAAPVQRALQDGVKETGVSLAFTVRALDAGPVIATERLQVDDQIKAPDLLDLLFSKGKAALSHSTEFIILSCIGGSTLLIRELPSILDGSAKEKAQPQDESRATLAPKITPEESWLSFEEDAFVLHNKVRAFAGWPGTRAKLLVFDKENGNQSVLELKIITTSVCSQNKTNGGGSDDISFRNGALIIPCAGSTELEVLEIQLPGKKVVHAGAFWNGLRGQMLKKISFEMC